MRFSCAPDQKFLLGSDGRQPLQVGGGSNSIAAPLSTDSCTLDGSDLRTRIENVHTLPGVGQSNVQNLHIAPYSVSVDRFLPPVAPNIGGTGSVALNPLGFALWSLDGSRSVVTSDLFLASPTGDVMTPEILLPDGSSLAKPNETLQLLDPTKSVARSFDTQLLQGSRPSVHLASNGPFVDWTVQDPNGDALTVYLRFWSSPQTPSVSDVVSAPHYSVPLEPNLSTVQGSSAKPGGTFFVAAVATDPFGFSPLASLTFFT